ncbi:MAG: DUF4160 domain-containing protein [Blastocatellia bacterium]
MPTVLRKDGFNFVIYTDDHEPMHTHVKKAGKEVVINLGDEKTKPDVRENKGMSKKNRRKALIIAAEHQELLIEKWREIHGKDD